MMRITVVTGNPVVHGARLYPGYSDNFYAPFYLLPLTFESNEEFEMTLEVISSKNVTPREMSMYIKSSAMPGYAEVAPGIYYSQDNNGPEYPENLKKYIQHLIQLDQPVRIFISGSKGVGKSTFSKYIANCILSEKGKVGFLDIDPGQPEISLPGSLSYTILKKDEFLLKPAEHQSTFAQHSVFYGSVNVNSNIPHMISCVEEIAQYASNDTYVIINSFGWLKNMGLEVHRRLLEVLHPECIITLTAPEAKPTILRDRTFCAPINVKRGYIRISSKEHRDIRIATYFSRGRGRITEQKTQKIFLSNVRIGFSCVDIPPTEALIALNGSVIAICKTPRPYKPTKSHITILDTVPPMRCDYFGIVKTIDTENNALIVVSPSEIPQDVNTVLMGAIHMPQELLRNAEDPLATFLGVGLYRKEVDEIPRTNEDTPRTNEIQDEDIPILKK